MNWSKKTLSRHPAETLAQNKWHAVTAINYIMLTSIFRKSFSFSHTSHPCLFQARFPGPITWLLTVLFFLQFISVTNSDILYKGGWLEVVCLRASNSHGCRHVFTLSLLLYIFSSICTVQYVQYSMYSQVHKYFNIICNLAFI